MTRARAAFAATAMLGVAAPVAAQDHSMPGMTMPGMAMPAAKKPAAKPAAKRKQPAGAPRAKAAPAKPAPAPMAGMDHGAMPGMQMPGNAHAGHAMPGLAMEDMAQTGTALPAGNAPPPPVPTDHAADHVYGADAMMMARHHLEQHHGGGTFHQVMVNLAEYQFRGGRDGYRWDGEAWYGGDIDRLFVKTEGEGTFREGVESAEVQALYSRAIGPYFNLQAGVRQDLGPSPKRTYATVGFEGLAPGQLELSGAAFLSNKGELLGRLEGYYDQRITQRLILQPRAELNFAAQDVPENRIGSGLSNAELGLRLRYEIRRAFAPYVGVSWDRTIGDTARFARAAGEDATSRSLVAGIRAWF